MYQNISRDNIDALLYGVENLPVLPPLKAQNVHFPIVGITMLNDQNNHNQMVLKHSLYGGEHDHYDRLGLTLIKNGKEILPDLGTTGYGAELHYGYYKNSSTHNTLVVNQSNQPPANPTVLNYYQSKEVTFVDTLVDWSLPIATVDSHTLVHWNETDYKDIQFRRSMLWLGSAAIEINQIINPNQQQLDLTWHTRGELISKVSSEVIDSPLIGPLARMRNCRSVAIINDIDTFEYDVKQDSLYQQYMCSEGGDSWLVGIAPDNPATSDLSYLLLRSQQKTLKNVVLHDLIAAYQLLSVTWDKEKLTIEYMYLTVKNILSVDFSTGQVSMH